MEPEANEDQRQGNQAVLERLSGIVAAILKHGAFLGRVDHMIVIDTTSIPEELKDIRSIFSEAVLVSHETPINVFSAVVTGGGRMYWMLLPWALHRDEGVDTRFPELADVRNIFTQIPVMPPKMARECHEVYNDLMS